MHVKSANYTRRFTGGVVIRDATTNDNKVTGHQRGRGLLIITRFDFPHADAEIDGTVFTKCFTGFTGIGIDCDQARIGSRQEQAAGTGGRLSPGHGISLCLAIFVVA